MNNEMEQAIRAGAARTIPSLNGTPPAWMEGIRDCQEVRERIRTPRIPVKPDIRRANHEPQRFPDWLLGTASRHRLRRRSG